MCLRGSRSLFAAGLFALALAAPALAEVAGGKPITLVVSYAAGGGADIMARLIAPKMAEALGQPVVVENKPGGGGQVAGAYVASAKPDGSTLLFEASGYAVAPALYPKMSYVPSKTFTPIAVVALFPTVLVANPGFPATTLKEVIAAARAAPGTIAIASSGNGSAQHLAAALFEDMAGLKVLHIPYRGGAPAMSDVMAGQVPLFFANLASALGHIQSKRLRAIAVASSRRAPALPDVPTMEEAGLPNYQSYEWNPLLAPAGIGADVKKQLEAAVDRALRAPDVQERIRALGGEPFPGGPEAAEKFLREQEKLWTGIVREHNIKVD